MDYFSSHHCSRAAHLPPRRPHTPTHLLGTPFPCIMIRVGAHIKSSKTYTARNTHLLCAFCALLIGPILLLLLLSVGCGPLLRLPLLRPLGLLGLCSTPSASRGTLFVLAQCCCAFVLGLVPSYTLSV